eukprot:GSChrysophyteH1.ASY1.ANO1.612.1 assembled CDS
MDVAPSLATESVMVVSDFDPSGRTEVRGFDFESEAPSLDSLAESMKTMGFQATNVGLAIEEIQRMLAWRLNPIYRANKRATIFLSYTSNLISSGVRETFKFLCKHKLVDAILKGKELRKNGWMVPILHAMTDEQLADPENVRWTPSKMIARLGKEINHEDSVYYWCYKNDIPVFCPAITDGSIGDMLYFHSYKRPELYLDIVQDIKAINDIAVRADCTGMFDGSDSGASPDEAISWGKIKIDSTAVKVSADVTLVFPLIVSQTFYKEYLKRKKGAESTN